MENSGTWSFCISFTSIQRYIKILCLPRITITFIIKNDLNLNTMNILKYFESMSFYIFPPYPNKGISKSSVSTHKTFRILHLYTSNPFTQHWRQLWKTEGTLLCWNSIRIAGTKIVHFFAPHCCWLSHDFFQFLPSRSKSKIVLKKGGQRQQLYIFARNWKGLLPICSSSNPFPPPPKKKYTEKMVRGNNCAFCCQLERFATPVCLRNRLDSN